MNIINKMNLEGVMQTNNLKFLPDLHIVGGYVRDVMMGIEPSDIDFATSASPKRVMELCKARDIKTIPTGFDHGTVTILLWYNDGVRATLKNYEVTTFRSDHNCDGRHADVEYVSSIEEDLARRDFTINAMAIDSEFNLIDPFGGQECLSGQLLKCVGDPFRRFTEDKLRIIRACRFAARFNFAFDIGTFSCMYALADQVFQFISVERFVMEMNKAFKMETPSEFLHQLYNLKIIQSFIPELYDIHKFKQHPTYHPEGDVWTHIMTVVDNAVGIEGRWIALLHDIGKGKTGILVDYEDYYSFRGHDDVGAALMPIIGKRLRLSNDLIKKMEVCARYHMRAYHIMVSAKKNKIRRFQYEVTAEYLPLLKALCIADTKGRKDVNLTIFNEIPEEIVFKPAVTGDMIMKFFKSQSPYNEPGPAVGKLKKIAMETQLETGITDVEWLLTRLIDEVYPEIDEILREKEDEYSGI
jgi:tRNA nucleotidyltransferase/poly(A) polymerase